MNKKLRPKNLRRIMRMKDEQHRRRRDAHIFSDGSGNRKKMPRIAIQWSGKQIPEKIEPSYVIENREISRPPAPKRTPKSVSEQKVRKYLADKNRGVIE